MKRKLIGFEVFNKLQENSLIRAENELSRAESLLGKTLAEEVKLYSFTNSDVTYKTLRETFIHANYKLDDKSITFDNIEEFVVDDKAEKTESKKILSDMVEQVLKNNTNQASDLFSKYMSLPNVRRDLKEATLKESCHNMKKGKKAKVVKKHKMKVGKKMLSDWRACAMNASVYLERKSFGPGLRNAAMRKDERGNIVALRIPNSKTLHEGKVLSMNYDVLNTEVKILRNKVKNEMNQNHFCREVANLRQANAVSDANKTEEIIENIVKAYPNVIYLSQTELAEGIKNALDMLGESNYDDEVTNFLAEGILRKATEIYEERVNRIMRIAGSQPVKSEDLYERFQSVTHKFYPELDESVVNEMQVYVDLYNTLVEVYRNANSEGNFSVKEDCNTFLKQIYPIVQTGQNLNPELASNISEWLMNLTETNLETAEWDVHNAAYTTINGNNPKMAELAKKSYNPASDFSGDWTAVAPVSDGKNYRNNPEEAEMRTTSWGYLKSNQEKDLYPTVENPYIPGNSEPWKMPSQTSVVNDPDPFGTWQDGDKTYPGLYNKYADEAGKPVTPYNYKMKNDDLVVDA